MNIVAVSAGTASNPWFWGTLMLVGIITAIKPHWAGLLNGTRAKDGDGEPTNLALAIVRGVGIAMAVAGGLYLPGHLNT